ncbi:MAG TPA: TonB-dependent receptor, partial [Caulobacteraceae bacterium]|nr:TonB-dependent receptor [Caulobacteraceae bacterium]
AVGFQALSRDFDAVGDEAYVPATSINEMGVYTLQRLDRGPIGFEAGLRVDQRELESVLATRDFTNWSGSAGVFFRPVRGLYLGLSVARNERAPSEVELFANGPHVATGTFEVGDADFESEVATSVEGAIHYVNARLTADLHVYAAKYDGFIDVQPTGVIDPGTELEVFQYVQTDAEFRGFEVEASYRLWGDEDRSLSLEGAADYVRGETDLGPPARIPPWSVTGRLHYEAPRWDAQVELRHVGEQDRIQTYELPTDSYTLVNLYASVKPLKDPAMTLFAQLRNATDEEAREHASFLKDIAPLPGRNLRVGVAYRF